MDTATIMIHGEEFVVIPKSEYVAGAETGASRVGERYIQAVLKACGLQEGWKG